MCIVLVLVAVRFGLWTMMAELCFSVDDFILFVYFVCFQQYSSRHRKRIRQLRAPSLLDSSGLVALLLLPAPRQAGRACSALCVLFSCLLLCALLCERSWQAELSFSVDNFILDFFSNTAADTASECGSYGHRRCWTAAASCSYYSCPHSAKPARLVLPCVYCSRTRCCAHWFVNDDGRALFFG